MVTVTERSATREWLAFLIDWIVLGLAWFVVVALFAVIAYEVLPSGMRFVSVSMVAVVTTLASIYWLFFSARIVPRSVGRRLVGADQPVSAWDAVRGPGPLDLAGPSCRHAFAWCGREDPGA